MKKLFILMLMFILFLTGCGDNLSIDGVSLEKQEEIRNVIIEKGIEVKSCNKYDVSNDIENSSYGAIAEAMLEAYDIYILTSKDEDVYIMALDKNNKNAISIVRISDNKVIYGEEPQTAKQKLKKIKNFLTVNIWNDGFCDITHYLHDGKDSTGATMDIDFTIEQLGKSMETKVEYDEYIRNLDDTKFLDVKADWEKLSEQIDILYGKLKEMKPTVGDYQYDFDTGLYKQYSDAFEKDCKSIE